MSPSGNLVVVVGDSKRGSGIDLESNGEVKTSVPWRVALIDCTSVNSARFDISFA